MCHLGEHMGLGLRSTLTKKKRILQTKKECREVTGKNSRLGGLCLYSMLGKRNRVDLNPSSANDEFFSQSALIFAFQFYVGQHLEKVNI